MSLIFADLANIMRQHDINPISVLTISAIDLTTGAVRCHLPETGLQSEWLLPVSMGTVPIASLQVDQTKVLALTLKDGTGYWLGVVSPVPP